MNLIEWTISGIIFFLQRFFIFESFISVTFYTIGILDGVSPIHISEFIEVKYLSILSDSSILKKNWSAWVLNFDTYSNDYVNWNDKNDRNDRKDYIE